MLKSLTRSLHLDSPSTLVNITLIIPLSHANATRYHSPQNLPIDKTNAKMATNFIFRIIGSTLSRAIVGILRWQYSRMHLNLFSRLHDCSFILYSRILLKEVHKGIAFLLDGLSESFSSHTWSESILKQVRKCLGMTEKSQTHLDWLYTQLHHRNTNHETRRYAHCRTNHTQKNGLITVC